MLQWEDESSLLSKPPSLHLRSRVVVGLMLVEAEGESQSTLTVQLNQREAAWMCCSPVGQQVQEGGHSTGEKKTLWFMEVSLKHWGRRGSRCVTWQPGAHLLKVSLSLLSQSITMIPDIIHPNNPTTSDPKTRFELSLRYRKKLIIQSFFFFVHEIMCLFLVRLVNRRMDELMNENLTAKWMVSVLVYLPCCSILFSCSPFCFHKSSETFTKPKNFNWIWHVLYYSRS